jgi:hypothetical protein
MVNHHHNQHNRSALAPSEYGFRRATATSTSTQRQHKDHATSTTIAMHHYHNCTKAGKAKLKIVLVENTWKLTNLIPSEYVSGELQCYWYIKTKTATSISYD